MLQGECHMIIYFDLEKKKKKIKDLRDGRAGTRNSRNGRNIDLNMTGKLLCLRTNRAAF